MSQKPAPATTNNSTATAKEMADVIRVLAMDAVEQSQSGHPGMPMGMADVATVLYNEHLSFDPQHPEWPNRDRFVLSAGHGSMLQYALLFLTGYPDITMDEIKNFRQLGAKTAGHPEYGHAAGIETTTGPLGQGLANAVGMALAERMLAARFGETIVDHRTYVISGDGCLMEGISQEAISMAGHWKLGRLTVLFDDNHITIDGSTSLSTSEDTVKRFESCGWHVQSIDGHDHAAISQAITNAKSDDRPSMIACRTTIGYGAPTKGGTAGSHGAPLGAEEIEATRKALGWSAGPFDVPEHILNSWRGTGKRGHQRYHDWSDAYDKADEDQRAQFERLMRRELPANWTDAINALKLSLAENQPKEASRKSSQHALEALAPIIPELIGGSADLTGSNNTKAKTMEPVTAENNYSGNYIYYGIREHGMSAVMNGLALHGGFIPYGGTFMVFTDYCRGAIRLSALMKQRVIYVMTHDSIGLGEDGPTHQPIEHLASLRAMPTIQVFRPADATETAECWSLALASERAPSILSLSRQGLPSVRKEYISENLCARGGYVLSECEGDANVTLIATGSEVDVALQTQAALADKKILSRVVSMPCWELFDAQADDYRNEVLGTNTLRVAIEAGVSFGWERYIGGDGLFFGLSDFGSSAPAKDLYKHFGITADNITKTILKTLKS